MRHRSTFLFTSLLGATVAATASGAPAAPVPSEVDWAAISRPSKGAAQVIGRHGAACLAGAVRLPAEGTGYQAVDLSRHRYYGHPSLVGFIGDLGRAVAAHQLGTMLVGDMAQPRGGPMSSGHVSHQGGLDVDVWFRLDVPPLSRTMREGIPQPSVVDPAAGRPHPARWTDRHAQLIRLAATDFRVSRVFVGAALKRDLCERSAHDRGWLRAVRTWPGHDDHLHIRLRCPPDSPACIDQPPPAGTDGCGTNELAAAFAHEQAVRGRIPHVPSRDLPPACSSILSAGE